MKPFKTQIKMFDDLIVWKLTFLKRIEMQPMSLLLTHVKYKSQDVLFDHYIEKGRWEQKLWSC